MDEGIPAAAGELTRQLTMLLEVMAQRQAQQAATTEAASTARSRYEAEVEELLSRPLPFPSPEETARSAAEHAARPGSDFSPTLLQTLQTMYERERTALMEAESAAQRLAVQPAVRALAQGIAECLRAFREITANGPRTVNPDTRARTREFLRQERKWSQERLHEMQSLSLDITEEEAAPLMREGLARSVGFFEAMSGMMEERAQFARQWEQERAALVQEALELAQRLSAGGA